MPGGGRAVTLVTGLQVPPSFWEWWAREAFPRACAGVRSASDYLCGRDATDDPSFVRIRARTTARVLEVLQDVLPSTPEVSAACMLADVVHTVQPLPSMEVDVTRGSCVCGK